MGIGGGSKLAGYRVGSLLGRGGAGAVYLADDLRLGRKVALKFLNPETADAPGVRERFVAESRIAASLDHPHIIPIYEAGESDGQLYIAMRYVPGADLAQAIGSRGVATERTIRIVTQVASALDAAHEAGLIHRDVKPGNILLAPGSEPGSDHAYLTDFGLTKQATYAGSDATKSGQLLGTIGYLAPEQIQGLPIDGRVDVYSLGCVLYECLAGRPPYPRDTDLAVLLAHVESPPPSLAAVRPELPPAIDEVIAKALAKNPDDRYASAGDLAQATAKAVAPSESRVSTLTRGFLFSDLRGFTDFVDAQGDRAAAELLETYRRLVRDVVRRFGGAEIKTEGDSFYVVFASASSAVGCGLAIATAAEAATHDQPTRPIRVAIGIHAGESTRTEDGYVGLAVNTAARICAQAQAGEVLVSETVRSIARTGHDFTFTARGRRHLKGIAEPVAVYVVTGPTRVVSRASGRPLTSRVALVARHPRAGIALAVVGALTVALAFLAAELGSFGMKPSPNPLAAATSATNPASIPPVASQSASAAVLSSPAVQSLVTQGGEPISLMPGRYTPAQFQLATEFEIPTTGWMLDREYADGFSLFRRDGVDAPVRGYVGAGLVQVVLDGPCADSKTHALARDPTALIDWLGMNKWLKVSDPRPINLAGYTGLRVEVTQARNPKGACDYSTIPLPERAEFETQVYIFVFGEDDFHVDQGEKLEIIVLDLGAKSVTLLVGVPESPNFESFVTSAQPVLDSLKFSP